MKYQFREGARILTFRNKITKKTMVHAINQSYYHNFRQSIPENINPKLINQNLYFMHDENDKLITVAHDKGYEMVKKYRQKLMDLAKVSWDEQQQSYSPSKRTSFDEFCQKHVIYLEAVLPNTRQEWFEAMGICQFSDIFVDDAKTGRRKMGALMVDSINWKKLRAWAIAEINFMRQWITTNLGSDIGFIYGTVHLDETTPHVHVGVVPLTKSFSKTMNKARYILSNNKNFGGSYQMRQFHSYHANYMTKAGFNILPGEQGSKGSYNAATFQEVKAIEKARCETEINSLLTKLQLESTNYQNYQSAKHYQQYYDQRIADVKNYLKRNEFDALSKNELQQYLLVLEQCRYYKIICSSFNPSSENRKMLAHYEAILDTQTIALEPILKQGYSLTFGEYE